MTSDPQWTPCEPGTLDSLRQPSSASPLSRRGVLVAAAAATAATLGGGVLLVRSRGPGGITCARVVELAPDYVSGELEADLVARIDAHRESCPSCDAHLQQLVQLQDLTG